MLLASAAIGSPVNEDGDCPKTKAASSVAHASGDGYCVSSRA